MEPITLGFTAALLIGLVFGAGPCNVTCLPYLGPVFLGEGSSWRVILPFSLGRMAGYTGLGAVAGTAGYAATAWVEEGWAAWLLGAVTVALGLLLIRSARRGKACGVSPGGEVPLRRHKRPMAAGLFGLGAGMALNPCAPLGTVLLGAAASGSTLGGAWLGFGFGLGAVAVPAVIFGLLVAQFGLQVRAHLVRWGGQLQQGAGVLMVLLGTFTIIGWVQP